MNQSAAELHIRNAIPADAPTIVDFNARLALESESKRLDPDVLAEGVRLALAKPELCRYFIAELGGRPIGQTMLTYEWSDWRAGVCWWIQSVYVAPEHRCQGVFKAIFAHIEALARSSPEVCGLRLYVEEHNQRAIETYKSMGLAPTGHFLLELDWSGAVKKDV